MSAALDIPADQIVRMRTDIVKVLHQLALTARDPRERRRAATTVLRALSPSPLGGGPGRGWRTRENPAHAPTTLTTTLSTQPTDPLTPDEPAPLASTSPTPPDQLPPEPPADPTPAPAPSALEIPTPLTPARAAHPAAALLTRLASQLMDAASPTQRANILYDALHPETAMNTPRATFIARAPRSHLAPLLRARAVQPSDPRDSPNIHGKATTFCILAAANNAHDTPALYQATLAPPNPPHTTDWSITDLKPIDSS
ncbi:MAG TPA: hypothetical protein VHN77_14260 [Phycisphaerales bacterium]|nr:hypothetical protein [Phycisphaerales bacterium]